MSKIPIDVSRGVSKHDIRETVRGLSDRSPALLGIIPFSNPNVFTFIAAVVALFLGFDAELSMRMRLAILISGNLVMFGVLTVATGRDLDSILLFKWPSIESIAAIPIGLAGVIAITIFLNSGNISGLTGSIALSEASPLLLAQLAIVLIIVFPLVEEILYRGLLFGYVLDYSDSLAVAALVVMGVFGLAHFEYGLSGVVTRTIASSVYLIQRIRYDSITESLLTHALFNAVVFVGSIGIF